MHSRNVGESVPMNSRLVQGDVTLINPDNRNDNRIKAPMQRYKVTRSYD